MPKEVWSGKQVNLSHLQDFGCVTTYLHIDAVDRSKLNVKSKKCYFIGYGSADMGYKFWDYQNKKILRNIIVIFNEEVQYKHRTTVDTETDKSKDVTT